MKPLFSVGEEVILQSVNHTDKNGDTVVLDIIKDAREERFTGHILEGYHYKLLGRGEGWWYESALCKKHKPSDDSFESMMSKLKTPIKAS